MSQRYGGNVDQLWLGMNSRRPRLQRAFASLTLLGDLIAGLLSRELLSRPRVLDSKPFQVVLAYHMDGEQRRFIPGSLSVQRVVSKKATYNGRVAQTMMEASCRIACDEGGEWARLPSLFAGVKTVNHKLEWVAADGTPTHKV